MLISKKNALNSLIVLVFILINLAFIFLQIHKQSRFVQLSYARQRLEKEREQLNKQYNELIHKIYVQQSRKHVQKYAKEHLGMRNTGVNQIHKIDFNETK